MHFMVVDNIRYMHFERKIKLNSFFFDLKNQNKLNKKNSASSNIPNIRSKSTWEP